MGHKSSVDAGAEVVTPDLCLDTALRNTLAGAESPVEELVAIANERLARPTATAVLIKVLALSTRDCLRVANALTERTVPLESL